MMSQENASRYVREHLYPNGIPVMNVGSGNNGAVTIFRKDSAGIVSSQEPGIKVVFQKDLHPSFTLIALPAPASQGRCPWIRQCYPCIWAKNAPGLGPVPHLGLLDRLEVAAQRLLSEALEQVVDSAKPRVSLSEDNDDVFYLFLQK